jgi:soluble lytic murein transglycosylase-like protein
VLTFLHHATMALGVTAIAALAIMFFKPELTDDFQAISPFFKEEVDVDSAPPASLATIATDTAATHEASAEENRLMGTAKQQQNVTTWLSKRYHVSTDATNMLVSEAYLTARDIQLDPLLILSVMAIESGLNPFAESPVGAQGLMQVMSKVHQEKFEEQGGLKAALNPVTNIRVGAQILKDYVNRGGSVEAGLKLYVGAALSDTDGGYGNRVLAEYKRLKDVANGKQVPTFTTTATAVAAPKVNIIKISDKHVDVDHIEAI